MAILVEQGGRYVQLASRHQGEIIGEMAIIDGKPRSASVIALEPCRLTVITSSQLHNRLTQLDPVLRLCMHTILDRFRSSMTPAAATDGGSEPRVTVTSIESVQALDALRLEGQLAHAIRNDELELHLQPIINLGDRRIAGFESLIRWRHPECGLVPPASFIPVAEVSGQIVEVTRWVIAEICRMAKDVDAICAAAAGRAAAPFFTINLSGQDLAEPGFVDGLERELRINRRDARHFKLEITESVLMQEPANAARVLGQCRDMGFAVAIDDFGTGYSSFDYLHRFPIDCLKIDRSFVGSLSSDHRARAIVGSMINLADGLEIPVVAEGIDDQAQASILDELGCTFAQGYLFAKPLLFGGIQGFVADWRHAEAQPWHAASRRPVDRKLLTAGSHF